MDRKAECSRVERNVHMGAEISCLQIPLINKKMTWYIFVVGHKSFHKITPDNYISTQFFMVI